MHTRHQTARFRLREGTADCHERVDSVYSRANLADRIGYGQFLVAQANVFLGAEKALEAGGIIEILPDWPARRRSHLLVQDLIELDLAVVDPAPALVLTGIPTLLGCAYVLEGSRLGAKLLRREIRADLPSAFLSNTYPNAWPTMVDVLDERLTEPSAIDQAIKAARALFALFESSGRTMKLKRTADVAQ